jgi:hypothetical protein
MIELHDWFARAPFPDRPWLVVGKGPTFQRRSEFAVGAYNTLSLNHVVTEMDVDVAHIMDIDVVDACADALRTNCRVLVMPRHPHVACEPSRRRLEDFFDAVPILRELDEQGRLVWYSSSGAPVPGATRSIRVRFFSSEAALGVLGEMGVRDVRTLGIDGGRAYGSSFRHLDDVTKLANGQPSFDLQFTELELIRRRYAMTLSPLVPALNVFVGAVERDLPAVRTLAHSISKYSSVPVHVTPLTGVRVSGPRRREHRARTPFSFARFAIPELCNHEGRAVYLDSDMLVFDDIAELATLPFGDARLLCTHQEEAPAAWKDSDWFHPGRQFSVMVLDCERLDWDVQTIVDGLDAGRYGYADLMFDMCVVPDAEIADTVPAGWNHLEHYEVGVTKLLHYTVVPLQPWRSDDNPLGWLWERAYRDAVRDGAVPWDEVDELVRSGEVKPSLADAFEDVPDAAAAASGDVVTMELQAVRAELERVRRRSLRGRVRGGLRSGWPVVRRVRDRWPGSPISTGADRLNEYVRSKL